MYKKYIKRLLDIILSFIGIILLLPLYLIISILVLIFMGWPIIFKQPRPGYKEKIFNMYKFRTMTNKKDKDGNLLPDDQRLNKFGKFLRSTSLDELPELFAILFGKMSIVGPRPMLVKDLVFFDDETKKRQTVLPGLTGWAQVNGRNSLTWDDRFKYDLYYVENISFFMDVKIIFMTIKTVLKRNGIGENGTDLSLDYGDYLLKHKRITKKEYDLKQKEAIDLLNGIYCKKEKGLVSIIMPSFNTGKFIADSIKSVIDQTYDNWELIIVDDCSTDNTEKVVKKYLKNNRIKYFKNEKNSGAAISRNRALREAKGEYIAFLDSDDLWDKEKLEKQINFMKNNNYFFTYTNYCEIDEKSNSLNKIITGPKKITKNGMYNYCWPGCLTVVYNQEKVGLIQIENLSKNNDYAMWLKVIEKTNCFLLDENLASYRIRKGSISRNSKLKLIKYHYYLYRIGEKKNILSSFVLTLRNLFFGSIKKILFVRSGKMDRSSILYKFRRKIQTIAFYVVPHSTLSKFYFKVVLNKKLNLENPQTFNEKLQWLKLYYYPNNNDVITAADKYAVRKYLKDRGLESILVPLIDSWDSVDEITWDKLPNQFVLKCNHGCAYNIVVQDKHKADFNLIKKQFKEWMKEDFGKFNVELHYSKIKKKKIICEKFLGNELTDYKFFCFNGIPNCLYVSSDFIHDRQAQIGFYNLDGKKMKLKRSDYKDLDNVIFPIFFDEMVEISKKLSKPFPFVRVDFFVTNNDFYFAELTFTPGAGMMPFNPDTYDLEWGKLINLDKVKKLRRN